MTYYQLSTLWNMSGTAIVVAGFIGWWPLFTGTIVPFLIVCAQVITCIVCVLLTVRTWKQQRKALPTLKKRK